MFSPSLEHSSDKMFYKKILFNHIISKMQPRYIIFSINFVFHVYKKSLNFDYAM